MPPTPPAPHGAGPGRAWLASPLLPLAVLVGGGALAGAAALRLLDRDWFDDGLHYYRAHAAHGALHDKVVRRAVVGLWLTAAVGPAAPVPGVAGLAGLVALAQRRARGRLGRTPGISGAGRPS
jgi:hypothetical protein